MPTKDEYVKMLKLKPHPEGGWYRQVYHSQETRYDEISDDQRYLYTSIYFILDGSSPSHLHRLLHDELWYFHDGASVTVHCFYPDGHYEAVHLGRDLAEDEQLQFCVPAGTIFGAEVADKDSFGLVSCAVAPGFDYRDFKLVTQAELLTKYSGQAAVIKRLAVKELPND